MAEMTIDPNAVMLTIKQRLLEAIDRAPIEELENTLAFLENRLTLQSPETHSSVKAVSILNQLAQINACAMIEDPIAWQKEIRSDRPLPGRANEYTTATTQNEFGRCHDRLYWNGSSITDRDS
jgi:hypothetical protein